MTLTVEQREYVRGRADWRGGQPDQELWLTSTAYRRGMADERADRADRELLVWAEAELATIDGATAGESTAAHTGAGR
jgi:hypothetical protein